MALPKIETPVFNITVPGIKEPVKCRPFLVKEEKLLILGSESEDIEDKISACSQIVSNCTFGKYSQENLLMYQLQWIFINVKAKSTGDILSLNLTCGECGDVRPFNMALTTFEVFGEVDEKTKDIQINDTVGVRIKLPTSELQAQIQELSDTEILINCVEYVWDGEEIVRPETESIEDMAEFIESLPIDIISEIQDFIISLPVVGKRVQYECVSCKKNNELFINGYEHFFV